jgi:hypothetical protein
LSERDNKEIPVVKEEETNDAEVFEEVVVEMARSPKAPKSSVLPPPGTRIYDPKPGAILLPPSVVFVVNGGGVVVLRVEAQRFVEARG